MTSLQPIASARRDYLGKYDLCAKLGRGGQAEVYLALMRGQAGFNKLVVIKKLRAEGDDPMRVCRFLDEARLAARLNHPNIVDTYEVGEDGGEYFIAMEYLEGQPMNRLVRNLIARERFTPAMWARCASEALRGLGYAHNLTDYDGTPLGIVHRDISPDNLFLTYDGEVKIMDFGIAKALLNSEKTETGILKGKLSYMAPEQVRGLADHRADLFSMGVVLWGFLTGRKLFEGEQSEVLYRLMTDPIPRLATELPDVDPSLAAIVDRALQKDPALRFQTAEEMREALEEFIRASGDLVSDVKLGKVVRETFAEPRQRVQRQVQAALSRAVPVGPGDEMTVGSRGSRTTLPEIRSITPAQELSGTLLSMAEAASAPVPAKQRRLVLLGTPGAAIVAITIAIAIALSTEESPIARAPQPAMLAPVEITSDPPGARVELNGNDLGRTPGRFELAPGRHTLIVTMDAYEAETLVVEATASPTSHAIILKLKAGAAARPVMVPRADDPVNARGTPMANEAGPARESLEASAPPRRLRPPRASSQRAPAARRDRTVAPDPGSEETAAPDAGITSPRVKVIEDDPR